MAHRRIIEEDVDEVYHHDVPYQRTYERESSYSNLMGLVVLLVVLILFFVYGLPLLRSSLSSGGTQINVPRSVDVNLNQPSK